MKRIILAVALIFALSGIAAAQSGSAKQATKKEEKAVNKKGPGQKADSTKTVLKQETSANAKSDSSVKLVLPIPKFPVDSTSLPVIPKKEE